MTTETESETLRFAFMPKDPCCPVPVSPLQTRLQSSYFTARIFFFIFVFV